MEKNGNKKESMMDVEVKEQIAGLLEAIEHTGDESEQLQAALTVCTLLVMRFTDSSYAAIGALEIMKKGVMEFGKEIYSHE